MPATPPPQNQTPDAGEPDGDESQGQGQDDGGQGIAKMLSTLQQGLQTVVQGFTQAKAPREIVEPFTASLQAFTAGVQALQGGQQGGSPQDQTQGQPMPPEAGRGGAQMAGPNVRS